MTEDYNFKRFDRKNKRSEYFINYLRAPGSRRLQDMLPSPNMKYLLPALVKTKGAFVDCGCGESADTILATKYGCMSYGLDLFPLTREANPSRKLLAYTFYEDTKNLIFIQQDVCKEWKIGRKANYVSSYAMITLMDLDDRYLFFRQVYQNLNVNGIFIVNYSSLSCGYGFESWEQVIKKVKKIGFTVLSYEKRRDYNETTKSGYTMKQIILVKK